MTTLPPGTARWRWLPNSLTGQVLLALAGALLLAQTISAGAALQGAGGISGRGLSHALALRATMAIRRQNDALQRPDEHGPDEHGRNQHGGSGHQPGQGAWRRGFRRRLAREARPILQGPTDDPMRPPRPDYLPAFAPGGRRNGSRNRPPPHQMLAEQDIAPAELMVVRRPLARDPNGPSGLSGAAVMGKHTRRALPQCWWPRCGLMPRARGGGGASLPLPDPGC
jgi:hypothetical protein